VGKIGGMREKGNGEEGDGEIWKNSVKRFSHSPSLWLSGNYFYQEVVSQSGVDSG
jgi:hypothetical protein